MVYKSLLFRYYTLYTVYSRLRNNLHFNGPVLYTSLFEIDRMTMVRRVRGAHIMRANEAPSDSRGWTITAAADTADKTVSAPVSAVAVNA